MIGQVLKLREFNNPYINKAKEPAASTSLFQRANNISSDPLYQQEMQALNQKLEEMQIRMNNNEKVQQKILAAVAQISTQLSHLDGQ